MGEPYGAFMYKVKPTEHDNLRTWRLKMIVSSVYYNNVQIVAFFPESSDLFTISSRFVLTIEIPMEERQPGLSAKQSGIK